MMMMGHCQKAVVASVDAGSVLHWSYLSSVDAGSVLHWSYLSSAMVGRCLTASVTESAAAKLVPEMWWHLQKLHCYISPAMCHINTTIFDAFTPWGIIPATLCGLVIVDEVHL